MPISSAVESATRFDYVTRLSGGEIFHARTNRARQIAPGVRRRPKRPMMFARVAPATTVVQPIDDQRQKTAQAKDSTVVRYKPEVRKPSAGSGSMSGGGPGVGNRTRQRLGQLRGMRLSAA